MWALLLSSFSSVQLESYHWGDIYSQGLFTLAGPKVQAQWLLQFSSVQFSCSVMSDSLRPHELQHSQASLSITNFRSSLKPTSIELVMPSSHLILCCPLLLLPPIPPSISLFQRVNSWHEVAKVLLSLYYLCRMLSIITGEHGLNFSYMCLVSCSAKDTRGTRVQISVQCSPDWRILTISADLILTTKLRETVMLSLVSVS